MQQVSDSTFLVKVKDQLRFVHIDHLRPSWTSGPYAPFRLDISEVPHQCQGERSSNTNLQDSLPLPRNQDKRTPSTTDDVSGADPTEKSSLEEVTAESTISTPSPEPNTQHSSIHPDAVLTSSEAAPLRRSTRARRPPERYEAPNFASAKKSV